MPMTEFRLLTLNALFKGDVRARLRALGRLLEESAYDLVCLQEVMYRSNLRHLGYAHQRASGAVLLRGGLVMLARKPHTAYSAKGFDLRKPARPEWLMRKGFQLSVVDGLTVVNTHLSANRDDDWSPSNRYTAIAKAELDELSAALSGIGEPLVVTGDFNLPRESSVLQEFIATNGLTDAMAGDTRPTYRPTPQWPNPPAFDHVLVRGLTARSELVFQEKVTLDDGRSAFLSDHYGIATSLDVTALSKVDRGEDG
jgi:endonuclease/exonuclease/phosphatase family metal-dependent hydrolase